MMSRGNEKSGFGVYIRSAFLAFGFFRRPHYLFPLKQKPPQG